MKKGYSLPIDEVGNLWESLTQEERIYLRENTELVTYKKNQKLYIEGEKPTHLFTLLEGKIKIFRDGVGGRQQIIRLANINQPLGHVSYFAQAMHQTSASALEPSKCYITPIHVIQQIIESNNGLAMRFIHLIAKNLANADKRILTLTQKHIRGRLADSILLLGKAYGYESDQKTLMCQLSREDLACLSNMTTSNAIRTLSNFISEGILQVDGRVITILDQDTLLKINRLG